MTKVEQSEPGVLTLQGDLLFSTVAPLRSRIEALLEQQVERCTLDFSAVARVDSSALSLWLACRRFAAPRNLTLQARGIPAEMQSIAHLVGLDQVLA